VTFPKNTTPQEIHPHIFRARIPLPGTPLQYLNSYIIKSNDRNLIVDTGFNMPECLEAMQHALSALQVDLSVTDFFITHLHIDHFNLLPVIMSPHSRVYASGADVSMVQDMLRDGLQSLIQSGARNGFPETRLQEAFEHPAMQSPDFTWLPNLQETGDGDRLDIASYHFECIATPGHSPGHLCLYEGHHKLLLSGDHILRHITPIIQCWFDHENPLKSYLQSLDRTEKLAVDSVLPAHHHPFHDCRQRIREIRRHHRNRLSEILDILDDSPATAFETAARMKWEFRADSGWENFPFMQQWFATGEAIAHLHYLENRRQLKGKLSHGVIRYHRH